MYNSFPTAIFIPAMTNINFCLGFQVNRENLDNYINAQTEYHSLLETSFGYAGVNIKIPLIQKELNKINLRKISYDEKEKNWNKESVRYVDYISSLPEKEKIKENEKNRYNTFLVFQSGNCILTSIDKECMRDAYNIFMDIIQKCKNLIEDKTI